MFRTLCLALAVTADPECSGQPERRVDAAEHEGADQERRHSPECPEEKWILVRIMVRRVCEVSGESTRGSLVALLASSDNVVVTEM